MAVWLLVFDTSDFLLEMLPLEDLRRWGRMMVAISTERNNGQNYKNMAQDVINKNDLI